MKTISILTPVYNEEKNIYKLYNAVKDQFNKLSQYQYEHIFIDNCSTDRSRVLLREIASEDNHVKVIFNTRNFGPNRSGTYGMLQASGDALICIVCDLQDPPEMIPEFLQKWEDGYKIVMGKKSNSHESPIMFQIRKLYYKIINYLADTEQLANVTGFGLYDKEVLDVIRWMEDPNPYIRGLVTQLGYKYCTIDYTQNKRSEGKSSYNFSKYFDFAITGVVHVSQKPLRLVTFAGMISSILFFIIALVYLILKLLFWDTFSMGTAPILIGLFFLGSVQLSTLGILGEYIGAILTRVTKRPMVIEEERINF